MKYIKQLDSIRAIAVIFVIISHWLSSNHIMNVKPFGAIGVDIFFVLSGFLITRILFESRLYAEGSNASVFGSIKNFYIRRTLRIFPIYYLFIFTLLLISSNVDSHIRTGFPYFVTYTSNFYLLKINGWGGSLSHLWSLAVEEQFYLIWPWVIFFANKKYFLHIIISFILIGVVGQLLTTQILMNAVITFNCFDAFGLGALLAWQLVFAKDKTKQLYKILSILAVISIVLYIIGATQKIWILPHRTLSSILALWVINYIIVSLASDTLKFKFIFNNKLLIFLGKISYGMYLYHNVISNLLTSKIIDRYLNPHLPDFLYKKHWAALFLVENIILLVSISWLSYVLIEKRFLNLKKYFEYENVPNVQPVVKAVV